MAVRQKPVEEQVIVITGASSGIGLATAHLFAERGARGLVLVARNEEALRKIADELSHGRTRAVAVAADVSKREDLERVARTAIDTFGGFDTWVNDAAVALYGNLNEIPMEDQRQLFDVNYWGVVNGSMIAADHMRRRGGTQEDGCEEVDRQEVFGQVEHIGCPQVLVGSLRRIALFGQEDGLAQLQPRRGEVHGPQLGLQDARRFQVGAQARCRRVQPDLFHEEVGQGCQAFVHLAFVELPQEPVEVPALRRPCGTRRDRLPCRPALALKKSPGESRAISFWVLDRPFYRPVLIGSLAPQ